MLFSELTNRYGKSVAIKGLNYLLLRQSPNRRQALEPDSTLFDTIYGDSTHSID